MASAKEKTKPEPSRYLTREIPGLVFAFAAVALFLMLVSFHPSDPSFGSYHSSVKPNHVIQNYFGLLGAYLGGLFIDLLGLSAFWLVLLLSVTSWRFFRGRPFDHRWVIGCGIGLLLLASAVLLSMAFHRLEAFWAQTPGGGVLGDYLAGKLIHWLNPVGAVLLTVVALLVSLILATEFSLIRAVVSALSRARKAHAKLEDLQTKRRAQFERSKRFDELADRHKDREAPKIKDKKEPPPKVEEIKALPRPVQEAFGFTQEGVYRLPSVELLDEPEKGHGGLSREALTANARLLEKKLEDFNVTGQVVEVSTGPVITMYEYQPAPGIKISKVAGLSDDLALNMRALSIRIVAPLPGKAAIGIEIPNPKRDIVFLKTVMSAPAFTESASLLSLVLGVDIMGQPEVADLQKMPHLLIAGATGSGKSVGLNAIIMSILYKARPDEVRFLMIDPKRIELAFYKDLPHLIYPVISEPADANQALKWAVYDMEQRYQLLAEKGVRNIEAYNRKVKKELAEWKPPAPSANPDDPEAEKAAPPEPLPYLVIIIDELADLMMVSPKEVEASITRLAQMARAAGIHLILATQRPSVDVLTGVIKANLPTRISFQVSSKIDSRTILDGMGAEKLLGQGDMLYMPPGTGKIRRIHGAYVSEAEIKRVTDFIKAQQEPDYLDDLAAPGQPGESDDNGGGEYDEKYDEAVALVARSGKASISLIQRHLRIGYNRAARIIEIMEKEGVVGPADGAKPRQVLVRDL